MKKLNNLVAIFVAVVMMMTVLAIFPSSVGAVEAQQVWKLNASTFATKVTDGPFTFGSVPGDNGAGSIAGDQFVPATLNANGTQLDTADGKVLFRKVNGAMCMNIYAGGVGTGYTTAIVFTAPEAGTYTVNFNFHKWGGGSTTETGVAVPSQYFYRSPAIFSENDTAKIVHETITLAEGEKIGFFTRGWGNENITINDLTITKSGTKESIDWNSPLANENITIFSAAGKDGKPDFANKTAFTPSSAAAPSGNIGTNGFGSTDSQQLYTLANGAKILEGLANTYTLICYKAPACGTYSTMYSAHSWSNCGNLNIYYFYGNETDGFTQLMNGDNSGAVRDDFWADNTKYDKSKTMTVEAGDYIIIAIWTGGSGVAMTVNEISFSCVGLEHKGTIETKKDANNHWTEYSCCGAEASAPVAHDCSEATCTKKATCKVCGTEVGELKAHNYSEATCTELAKCKDCGATTGALKAHNYKDGICADCFAKDPNYTPDTNPETADTVISVATVIAAVSIFGFAIFTKKRH